MKRLKYDKELGRWEYWFHVKGEEPILLEILATESLLGEILRELKKS